MTSRTRRGGAILKTTVKEFSDDGCATLAAALAFYAVFSIPPLILIVMTITGWLWSEEFVSHHIDRELQALLGTTGKEQLLDMIRHAQKFRRGLWPTISHVAILLIGSTGLMTELQVALNQVWGSATDRAHGGIRQLLLKRILSFGMVMVVALLLLVSMILSTLLSLTMHYLHDLFPDGAGGILTMLGHQTATSIVVTLLFAMLFKWLPDVQIRWADAGIGALFTAVLFMLGKTLLGWYLGQQNPDAYGAAGALVLLLMWVYYSMMILLLGAEFTQVWSRFQGHRRIPARGAMLVSSTKSLADASGSA